MKFYRVDSTELLPEGVCIYTFFVSPEGLDTFLGMFEKHKEIHHLSDPYLVEIEIDPEGKPIRPDGLTNLSIFIVK